MRAPVLLLMLAACDAGHLGNPLTLPLRGVGAAIANAPYDARRARVAEFVARNAAALQAEARGTPGPAMAALVEMAGVTPGNLPMMRRALAEISAAPPPDWVEQATVIAMVHGG